MVRASSASCGYQLQREFSARDLQDALLGREPINLPRGRLARVRYASQADKSLRRNEMTRLVKGGQHLSKYEPEPSR